MNEYGKRAQRNWISLAPTAYSQIPDPNQHFSELGLIAEQQIGDLTIQLTGPDEPNEEFWHKVGRIEAAKWSATELISHELLTPPRDQWDPDPDQDEPIPGMKEFYEELAAERERQEWEQQKRQDRMMDLVDQLRANQVPDETIFELAELDWFGQPDGIDELKRRGLL